MGSLPWIWPKLASMFVTSFMSSNSEGMRHFIIPNTVLTLQSLNAKLQKDLREEVRKLKRMEESVAEHKTVAENLQQKNRDLMMLLQQKVR